MEDNIRFDFPNSFQQGSLVTDVHLHTMMLRSHTASSYKETTAITAKEERGGLTLTLSL